MSPQMPSAFGGTIGGKDRESSSRNTCPERNEGKLKRDVGTRTRKGTGPLGFLYRIPTIPENAYEKTAGNPRLFS